MMGSRDVLTLRCSGESQAGCRSAGSQISAAVLGAGAIETASFLAPYSVEVNMFAGDR